MIKRVISFTDPQDEWLIKEADRFGISVVELARRIIDWYREPQPEQQKHKQSNAIG